MIKMREPYGKTFGGPGGRPIHVESDGSTMVHPADVDVMLSHGFLPWHDVPGGDIDAMSHAQLVDFIVARTRNEAMRTDVEVLRASLRNADDLDTRQREADREPTAEEIEEAGFRVDADTMTEERIAMLKRPELFAYLKAKGVAIGPATKEAGLRAAALDTLPKRQA